jgi:hypothetical protein
VGLGDLTQALPSGAVLTRGKDSTPSDPGSDKIVVTESERHRPASPKAKTPRPYTHNRQPLTAEILVNAMGGLAVPRGDNEI